MNLSRRLFPIGAILVLAGVAMAGELDRRSFHSTQDWEYHLLGTIFLPSLLVGSGLAMVGAVFDRRRLPAKQSRARGWVCLFCCGVSFVLFEVFGNVHGWTFMFFFPMITGFVSGTIFMI
jgi:hypothetical protein